MEVNKTGMKDWTSLMLVVYVTILGAAVRLVMPIYSPAPLNDGGLFHAMITDLQANQFVLPEFTTYNAAHIPFAYPPLALYFTALLSSAFHIPVFDLIRLLPPILSALSIPAFHLLAKEITESRAQAALAVIIYAFIPRTIDWLIMGGGITRSLGLIFALLAMRQFYLLFKTKSTANMLPSMLLGALVIYTHPEAAVHAALSAAVFYLMLDRSIRGLRSALIVGMGVLLLSAPWWVTTAARHGIQTIFAPMLAAGGDSLGLFGRIFSLLVFRFTDENLLTVAGVLGLLGLAALLAGKRFLLPAWMVTLFIVEPRGGTLFMMIPLAMMAAYAAITIMIPGLERLAGKDEHEPAPEAGDDSVGGMLKAGTSKVLVAFLLLYGMLSAVNIASMLRQTSTLTAADLEAFDWVKANTEPGANFALITSENALRDPSSEWFPTLAERRSEATLFGYEWINDGLFTKRRKAYESLQACADQDVECLEGWTEKTGEAVDYLYIRKMVQGRHVRTAIAEYLALSGEYEPVYETETVIIFYNLSAGQ